MTRTGRLVFDSLERRLAPLAVRNPGFALAGADRLGRLRNRLSRRWPSPEEVRTLFPHLSRRAAARTAWSIGGLEARNRLLVTALLQSGLGWLRPLVRVSTGDLAALRPPLILGSFHVGALHALGPALERLAGPVLVLRQSALYGPKPPVELEITEGDEQHRAASFYRALLHLRGGGFVFMALDLMPDPGTGPRVSCLGGTLELARGPFALARLSGAPLAPIAGRWREAGVEIVIGEALGGLDRETDLAASAARWLEDYLARSPAEIGLGLLRALLGHGLSPQAGRT